MKLELTIPTQMVADAIASGVQGGIQYWAKVIGFGRRLDQVARASLTPTFGSCAT